MEYNKQEPDKEALENFIQLRGRRVAKVLKNLAKQNKFVEALGTPIGQELLADVMEMMEAKLNLIIEEEADDKDRADYRAYKSIYRSWHDKIAKHRKGVAEINIRGGKS